MTVHTVFEQAEIDDIKAHANLRSAEESLRDIRERIEHCGGGPDELNRQINAILDRYWKTKNQRRDYEVIESLEPRTLACSHWHWPIPPHRPVVHVQASTVDRIPAPAPIVPVKEKL